MAKDVNKYFSNKRYANGQSGNKTLLNIIHHQGIKTSKRYHFTSTRMAIIKRWMITSVDQDAQ